METSHSKLNGSPLPFLHLMEVLKHLPRTGWLRTIKTPESVAAHMYRLSLLAMLAPNGLDMGRCIFLALCHDMAESVVGDIPTYAGVTKEHKFKLEDFGTRYIESLLKPFNPTLGSEIRAAWLEYETGKTAEARWVQEMDKLECLIQAHEYEQKTFGEKDLEEFQGLSLKLSSPEGITWSNLLQDERQTHFLKRKRRIPIIFLIGPPGIGKKTQSALICQKFGFQHVSLDAVLYEKCDDQMYPHAEFVKDCLREGVNVPRDLKINLLERKVNEGMEGGKKWSLVHGFPESMQEVHEFEQKVQKNNYTLLFNCSAQGWFHRMGSEVDDELHIARGIHDFQVQNAEMKNHLKAAKGYFKEINGTGSLEDVHDKVTMAVTEFIQHEERTQRLESRLTERVDSL